MGRSVLAGLAGYVGWWIIGTLGFLGLRVLWPEYARVESAMAFSLSMQLARLAVAALCSVGAGLIAASIGRRRAIPWVLGAVLTLQFLPVHYQVWSKYPLWYHGFFLFTLLPLVLLGFAWRSGRASMPQADAAPHSRSAG